MLKDVTLPKLPDGYEWRFNVGRVYPGDKWHAQARVVLKRPNPVVLIPLDTKLLSDDPAALVSDLNELALCAVSHADAARLAAELKAMARSATEAPCPAPEAGAC